MEKSLSKAICVVDLADACKLSPCHFSRAFTRTVGVSPYEWHLARRIVRATELLMETARPLAVIALDCGFVDQSHFTRTFARRVGMPPGRYRLLGGNRPTFGPPRRLVDPRAV